MKQHPIRFEFATSNRIIFGAGAVRETGALAAELGHCALVVTGKDASRAAPLLASLSRHNVEIACFQVSGEPELATIEQGTAQARRAGSDLVVSIGGGSVLDAGKAVAAMLTNEGALLDYLEIIGRGLPLTRPSLPFIAVPTTAGTGSEVTRNAVLAAPEQRVKVSLRSPWMLPRVALVDPELTHDLPPALTASTGLDALTQLIEPFVCTRANPMTDALCADGVRRAARSLRTAYTSGQDKAAREDMALASLYGGLALANAGLGAVHGLAGPIGGMFPAPHGAVCAALLPHVMTANLAALNHRQSGSEAVRRYSELARLLTGSPAAVAADGIEFVRALVTHLNIPCLRRYGISNSQAPEIAEKALKASSMKANPIALTHQELLDILAAAI